MTGAQLLTRPGPVETSETESTSGPVEPNRWWARAFGGMFLAGGLAHLVLLSVDSGAYDTFADKSYLSFVTHEWRSVLVANVYYLVPLLAVFEVAVGWLILTRRHRRVGIALAAVFNATLMLFGWGFFFWSIPVIVLLGSFMRRELHARARLDRPGP